MSGPYAWTDDPSQQMAKFTDLKYSEAADEERGVRAEDGNGHMPGRRPPSTVLIYNLMVQDVNSSTVKYLFEELSQDQEEESIL